MGLARRDLERHTYGDYLAWPEDVRYELIDGVAYAMSPAPTVSHQEVLLELSRQIDEAMDESACADRAARCPPAARRRGRRGGRYRGPAGLLVVRDPARIDERGVREYWLVHPTDRIVTVYRLENGHYGRPDIAELAGETATQAVPGLVIDWARATRRLPAL